MLLALQPPKLPFSSVSSSDRRKTVPFLIYSLLLSCQQQYMLTEFRSLSQALPIQKAPLGGNSAVDCDSATRNHVHVPEYPTPGHNGMGLGMANV